MQVVLIVVLEELMGTAAPLILMVLVVLEVFMEMVCQAIVQLQV